MLKVSQMSYDYTRPPYWDQIGVTHPSAATSST